MSKIQIVVEPTHLSTKEARLSLVQSTALIVGSIIGVGV